MAAAQLPWEAETAAALGAISAAAGRPVGAAVAAAAVAVARKEAEMEGAAAVGHANDAERAAARGKLEGVLAELGVVVGAACAEAGQLLIHHSILNEPSCAIHWSTCPFIKLSIYLTPLPASLPPCPPLHEV